VDQLHPEIIRALRAYFQEHALGDLETENQLCCETISRKKQTGTLAARLSDKPDRTIYTGIVLTSQWLIWVHHGDTSGTLLNAADLHKIGVRYYTPLFTKDAGLEIIGYIGDSNARVRGYIGMGTDPVVEKFCEEVRQAIIKANPPAPRKIFNWPVS
jgi:hypothetical protein